MTERPWPLLLLLSAAVAAAILLRGGFFAPGRAVFVVFAGAAFLVAVLRDDAASLRYLKAPPVLVVAALGALALASVAWTVGESSDAVSTALVLLSLPAVIAAAGVAGGSRSSERIAVVIALLAAVTALAGLLGVAVREEPWAQRIGGAWRPGGTFEYPPALALLQVAALPALLTWMQRPRATVAGVATLGATVAAATLALSESRLQVGFAGLVMLAALAWPAATVAATRLRVAAAIALLAAAAVAAGLVAGGYARPVATGQDAGRLLGLGAILAAGPVLWLPVRRALLRPISAGGQPRTGGPFGARGAVLAALAAAVLVATALAVSPPVKGSGGFTHGRVGLWGDAVATAMERPLLGWGADSFLMASAERQGEPAIRYAHNLPLELWAELGVAGLLLVLALYATSAVALVRARGTPAMWLLGPAVAAFLVTNLVDWPWHLAGAAAVWALALGGVLAAGSRSSPATPE